MVTRQRQLSYVKFARGHHDGEEESLGVSRTRRAVLVVLAVLAFAVASPSLASAYWDFQGTLTFGASPPNGTNQYGETNYLVDNAWIPFRLSRNTCNAKWQQLVRGLNDAWYQWPIPGGCATGDTGVPEYVYWGGDYWASRAINNYCCTVFANVYIGV
jgi:hypothetical protein